MPPPKANTKSITPAAPAATLARSPELYSRRVLLCMAGLTPATITETVYALAVPPKLPVQDGGKPKPDPSRQAVAGAASWLGALGGQGIPEVPWRPARKSRLPRPFVPFVPTEIHLITTVDGQRTMMGPAPAPGEMTLPTALQQLTQEYAAHFGSEQIKFSDANVHVIRRPDGTPVNDFATEADSEATGNAILDVLRELTADDECAIHASYAGGRKSMSAMLVLAMSLLGRKQDRLSQVLIPAAFEGRPFLYPPAQPVAMTIKGQVVNTRDAHVTLAMLPLLRVFDGLGLRLRDPEMGFEDVIELGELALEKRAIIVKPIQQTVQIGHLLCRLSPAEIGFYTLLATRRAAGAAVLGDPLLRAGGLRWRDAERAEEPAGFEAEDPLWRRAAAWFGLKFDANPVPDGKTNLRHRVSAINKKLLATFGPELAEQALIVGPGKETKGDGIYGLFNADGLNVSA